VTAADLRPPCVPVKGALATTEPHSAFTAVQLHHTPHQQAASARLQRHRRSRRQANAHAIVAGNEISTGGIGLHERLDQRSASDSHGRPQRQCTAARRLDDAAPLLGSVRANVRCHRRRHMSKRDLQRIRPRIVRPVAVCPHATLETVSLRGAGLRHVVRAVYREMTCSCKRAQEQRAPQPRSLTNRDSSTSKSRPSLGRLPRLSSPIARHTEHWRGRQRARSRSQHKAQGNLDILS